MLQGLDLTGKVAVVTGGCPSSSCAEPGSNTAVTACICSIAVYLMAPQRAGRARCSVPRCNSYVHHVGRAFSHTAGQPAHRHGTARA